MSTKNLVILLILLCLIAVGISKISVPARIPSASESGASASSPLSESGERVESTATPPAEDFSNSEIITGTYECLPHADQSGPQTLECALGIQEDGSGSHYALDTSLVPQPSTYATGAHLRVRGLIVPAETLNSDQWKKYGIEGIIRVTQISEL